MNKPVTIRSCSLRDAQAIVSIGIKTFRDTFDEMNTPENMMLYLNRTFTLKKVREEIGEKNSMFFIAEQSHKTAGYARIRVSADPGGLHANAPLEIERLYVDTPFLGKRVGYLLMKTCLHYAGDNGHDVVWLGVWEHNLKAQEFYRKWGFEKFGEHTFMLGNDAQTDWLMQKKV